MPSLTNDSPPISWYEPLDYGDDDLDEPDYGALLGRCRYCGNDNGPHQTECAACGAED
ncbi:MAG: hypothetical protein AB7P40_19335 [Chloroflexota bacterium]